MSSPTYEVADVGCTVTTVVVVVVVVVSAEAAVDGVETAAVAVVVVAVVVSGSLAVIIDCICSARFSFLRIPGANSFNLIS